MPWGYECKQKLLKQVPAKPTQPRAGPKTKSPGPSDYETPTIYERWCKKIKKYENKLQETRKKYRQWIFSASYDESENEEQTEESTEQNLPGDKKRRGSKTVVVSESEREAETATYNYSDVFQSQDEGESEIDEFTEKLQDELANRFHHILLNGLRKETKDEILRKSPYPKNFYCAKAPLMNTEISTMLLEKQKVKDKCLYIKQDQLGRSLSSIGKAMTILLKTKPDIAAVIKLLNEAGKLIADVHYNETEARRANITCEVDNVLSGALKCRQRDSYLFGYNLGEIFEKKPNEMSTMEGIPSTSSNINKTETWDMLPPPQRWRQPMTPPATRRQLSQLSQPPQKPHPPSRTQSPINSSPKSHT